VCVTAKSKHDDFLDLEQLKKQMFLDDDETTAPSNVKQK